METIYENDLSPKIVDDLRNLKISDNPQPSGYLGIDVDACADGVESISETRADNIIVRDFEVNEAFFAFYGECIINNSKQGKVELRAPARKARLLKSIHHRAQKAALIQQRSSPQHTFKGNGRRSRTTSSNKVNKKTTKKHKGRSKRFVARSQFSDSPSHSHDNSGIMTITEATCPLCCMGVPLHNDVSDIHEDQGYHSASPVSTEKFCKSKPAYWSTSDLTDAITSYDDTRYGMDAPAIPLALPLDKMHYTQLVGGPSGYGTLLTTSACKACRHAVDAFANLGGHQAFVVADCSGTACYHFYCATQEIVEAGHWANDWHDLESVLVARSLYLYRVQSQGLESSL